MLRLPLEAVREISRVREVHRTRLDEGLQQCQEAVFVWIADLSSLHGEELGRDDFVYHVALQSADRLRFGNSDDILVYIQSVSLVPSADRMVF